MYPPLVLRETCKVYVRGLIISYVKSKNHKSPVAQKEMESQLADSERTYASYPSDVNMKGCWLQELL